MRSNYNKEFRQYNLLMVKYGLVFVLVLLLLTVLTEKYPNFMGVFNSMLQGVGLITLIFVYFLRSKKNYFTPKMSTFIKTRLFPKKIKWMELKSIREYAGNFKMILSKSELTLDTHVIDANSLAELKTE
ncbi:MAG: hypothetical protein WC044_10485 [Crocinitomicaceae bacterium]